MGSPVAAASSASAAPDDSPTRLARPPAALIRAARSSTSRASEYVVASPLAPRPRRSYVMTVNLCASSGAIRVAGPKTRLQNAPSTTMTAGPLPRSS
jgi:hypothetical protein